MKFPRKSDAQLWIYFVAIGKLSSTQPFAIQWKVPIISFFSRNDHCDELQLDLTQNIADIDAIWKQIITSARLIQLLLLRIFFLYHYIWQLFNKWVFLSLHLMALQSYFMLQFCVFPYRFQWFWFHSSVWIRNKYAICEHNSRIYGTFGVCCRRRKLLWHRTCTPFPCIMSKNHFKPIEPVEQAKKLCLLCSLIECVIDMASVFRYIFHDLWLTRYAIPFDGI